MPIGLEGPTGRPDTPPDRRVWRGGAGRPVGEPRCEPFVCVSRAERPDLKFRGLGPVAPDQAARPPASAARGRPIYRPSASRSNATLCSSSARLSAPGRAASTSPEARKNTVVGMT